MATRRVLVVDDNAELADNIAEILEAEGYDTRVAYHPREALAIAEAHSFEVMILDVRLPGMDGVSLYGELRRGQPAATYLLMTAFTRDERIAEALDAGVTAVLAKPVPVAHLLSLLPPPTGDLPAVLVVEDDPALADSLRELLGTSGYRAEVHHTLADARRSLARQRPGAVLVDIRLPDGDGCAFAQELCEDRDLPVVVMTAYDPTTSSEAVRLACGEQARFLAKPFDAEELLRTLDELSAGVEASAAP